MTTHVEGASGTRGNGQKAVKQLESKYLKNTNKMIPATQEALATTSMTSGQDLDHINELTRLRNLLTEIDEPITDGRFTDIFLESLTEEYRDVKHMPLKEREIHLPNMQFVLNFTWTDCRGIRRDRLLAVARSCQP